MECSFCAEVFPFSFLKDTAHPVRRGAPMTGFGWSKAGLPMGVVMCPACRDEFRAAGYDVAEFEAFARAWKEREQVLAGSPRRAKQPAPTPDPSVADVADEIGKLFALKEAGALTAEEFDAQKALLLGGARPVGSEGAGQVPAETGASHAGPADNSVASPTIEQPATEPSTGNRASTGESPGLAAKARPKGGRGCLGCLAVVLAIAFIGAVGSLFGPTEGDVRRCLCKARRASHLYYNFDAAVRGECVDKTGWSAERVGDVRFNSSWLPDECR